MLKHRNRVGLEKCHMIQMLLLMLKTRVKHRNRFNVGPVTNSCYCSCKHIEGWARDMPVDTNSSLIMECTGSTISFPIVSLTSSLIRSPIVIQLILSECPSKWFTNFFLTICFSNFLLIVSVISSLTMSSVYPSFALHFSMWYSFMAQTRNRVRIIQQHSDKITKISCS